MKDSYGRVVGSPGAVGCAIEVFLRDLPLIVASGETAGLSKDPDWYIQNAINGFPGLKGKKARGGGPCGSSVSESLRGHTWRLALGSKGRGFILVTLQRAGKPCECFPLLLGVSPSQSHLVLACSSGPGRPRSQHVRRLEVAWDDYGAPVRSPKWSLFMGTRDHNHSRRLSQKKSLGEVEASEAEAPDQLAGKRGLPRLPDGACPVKGPELHLPVVRRSTTRRSFWTGTRVASSQRLSWGAHRRIEQVWGGLGPLPNDVLLNG